MLTKTDIDRGYARYLSGERPWPVRASTWHVVMEDGGVVPLKYLYALTVNAAPADIHTDDVKAAVAHLQLDIQDRGADSVRSNGSDGAGVVGAVRSAYVLRMKIDDEDRVPGAIQGGQALMGWPTDADLLDPALSKAEIATVVHHEYYEDEPSRRKAASAARNLWRFLREMQIGDWIIVPWRSKYFYVGQVMSAAAVSQPPNDDCFSRGVTWLNPESALRRDDYPHLGRLMGNRTACYPIGSALLDIEQLAKSLGWTPAEEARPDIVQDIEGVYGAEGVSATQREALVLARLGQGAFRANVLRTWQGACAVSGCAITEVLRASHMKPWRDATNEERLDPDNGIPLLATLDALFDRGLISFGDDGEMLVSDTIPLAEQDRLGVPAKLSRPLTGAQKVYLSYHRESIYVGSSDAE